MIRERPQGVLNVATFRGSFAERGRQHGELFGERARRTGILGFYGGYCEGLAPKSSFALRAFLDVLHRACGLRRSPRTRELVEGFSRASGIPAAEVYRALAMPDAINWLAGFKGRLDAFAGSPAVGCTSAAAWGPYTRDGRFLYARNLDFVGNGYWDHFPLIARHRPDQGIPYVSVGTAGLIVDGITGANEEGLTVALQQHLSTDIRFPGFGRPILDLCHRLLQFSRGLDEAAEEAMKWPVSSCWTVVLTHFRERRACLVERASSRARATFFSDGKMARTNDYDDPTLKAKEIDYPVWRQSSRLRLRRAQALLEEGKGRIDAAYMAGILRDRMDVDRAATRGFAQAIANPNTLSSVVIDPQEGALWAAEGPGPACDGRFRRVALWDDSAPGPELPGVPETLSSRRAEGCRHYVDAMLAWQEGEPDAAVAQHMGLAAAADPDEPTHAYLGGFFALRGGDAKKALELFSVGAAVPDLPHRQAAQRLWQARALDLLGRRDEAARLYDRLAAEKLSGGLAAAARKGRARAFTAAGFATITPDFAFGDVYSY